MIRSPEDDVPAGVVVGETLAGKYLVDRVLGAGGMGVVVQATHMMLNTRVAMKFLLPQYAHDQRIVTRFLREARAAVSIKNRHVASVIDIGTLESGSPYIVMEYLEGSDLGVVIDAELKLEPTRAARFLLQACQGLASAHAGNVVHRDIKPGNLFITRDVDGSEQVKILDFGISKSGGELTDLTSTGAIMGSPTYMPPEQMRSTRNVDHRADIWSLGVVGFEMLTGRLPYEAETMTELVAMVIEHDPPRVRMLRPDVSEALDEAIAGALVKNPDKRYANVAEFAQALANAVGDASAQDAATRTHRILFGAGGGTDPTGKFASQRNQPSVTTGSSLGNGSFIRTRPEVAAAALATSEAQSKKRIILGVVAVLVALAVGATAAVLLDRDPPAVAPAPQPVPVIEERVVVPVAAPAQAEPAAVGAAPTPAPTPTPSEPPASTEDLDTRPRVRTTVRAPATTTAPSPTMTANPAPTMTSDDPFLDRQ